MTELATMISHGRELARNGGIAEPTIEQAVWELLIEAAATLNAMPDRERAFLQSCERTGWPDPIRDAAESYGYEPASHVRHSATSGAVDRLHAIMAWFPALSQRVGRKCRVPDCTVAFLMAAGVPLARVRRKTGLKRRSLYNARDRGLRDIVRFLTWA